MGKMTIEGRAEKTVACDVMKITIEFQVSADSSFKVLKEINAQCEEFLQTVSELIPMKEIHVGDNKVCQEFDDETKTMIVLAQRQLTIKSAFDMKLVNYFMKLSEEKKYDVNISVDYELSNSKEIHDTLIKEAFADSRKKAEMIAESIGGKISGIKSLEIGDRYVVNKMLLMAAPAPESVPNMEYTSQLQAPTRKEEEKISVVWIIESFL